MMDKGDYSAAHLLRMIGLFGIAIGVAWAVQTLGFGASTLASRLLWMIAAASMAGAGAGLLIAAYGLPDARSERDGRRDRLEPIFD